MNINEALEQLIKQCKDIDNGISSINSKINKIDKRLKHLEHIQDSVFMLEQDINAITGLILKINDDVT